MAFKKSTLVKKGVRPVFYVPYQAFGRVIDFDSKLPLNHKVNFKPTMAHEALDSIDNISENLRDHFQDGPFLKIENKFEENVIDFLYGLDWHIWPFIKFYDSDLADDDPDNYYFEREWRIIGNIEFEIKDVTTIFSPNNYLKQIRNDYPDFEGQLICIDNYINE